jgi:hypothetical protein
MGYSEETTDGIVEFLKTAVHPEIHHFRAGSHPGLGWWLKTVFPHDDFYQYGRSWEIFASIHPDLVCIGETAYDWTGNQILGWGSVWVADDHDVQLVPRAIGLQLIPIAPWETDLDAAQSLMNLMIDNPGDIIQQAALVIQRNAEKKLPNRNRRFFQIIRGKQDGPRD